jgi:hypothetical protein
VTAVIEAPATVPVPAPRRDTAPVPGPERPTAIVRVDELQPFDRIVACTNLGPFVTLDDVTVKFTKPADRGKHAVNLTNVGTLFLPDTLMVTVLDKDGAR